VKIHTQAEAAAILRVSITTITRIRQSGQIAFIPGRPVKITDAALNEYIKGTETWHDPTTAPISTPRKTARSKSGGQTTDDLSAARQARKIFLKLKKS
jgi:hypothetical protein